MNRRTLSGPLLLVAALGVLVLGDAPERDSETPAAASPPPATVLFRESGKLPHPDRPPGANLPERSMRPRIFSATDTPRARDGGLPPFSTTDPLVPDDLLVAEFARALGPALLRSLPEAPRERIFDNFRDRINAPLEPTSYLCWAVDTPANIVEASVLAEEAAGRLAQSRVSAEAFQFLGSGRWSFTALDGSTGTTGTPATLTWSIAPDGSITDEGEPSDLIARLAVIYAGQSANTTDPPDQQPWFPLLETALASLSAETGVMFVYEPNDDGATMSSSNDGEEDVRGDLRIFGARIDGNSQVLAYNYSPGYGDMVLDTDDSYFSNLANNSRRLRNVFAHEIGHGLGLGHVCPSDNTKLMEPFLNTNFDGAQFDDIYSLQRKYGDLLERHSAAKNNDSAGNAAPLTLVQNGTLAIPERLSIDDNSDSDFYEITVAEDQTLVVTATPTSMSYFEGGQNPDGSCGTGSNIDFSSYHDLALEIRDGNGITVLASGNTQGEGVAETLSHTFTSAGTAFVRVSGDSTNQCQIYALSLELINPSLTFNMTKAIAMEAASLQNGVADPGETIALDITLESLGSMDATNVTATLTGPAGFVPFTTVGNYGTIAPSALATETFIFALNGACGDTLLLNLNVTAAGGFSADFPIALNLGEGGPPETEDVEEGGGFPAGWSSSGTGSSNWFVSSLAANSGTYSFFASGAANGNTTWLDSPVFTAPVLAGSISFTHSYDTEFKWDGGTLDISIAGGAWQDIISAGGTFTQNGYDSTLNSSANSLTGRLSWTGNSGGFITTSVDLPPAAAGQAVQLRWTWGNDASGPSTGWFVDDLVTPSAPACDTTGPAFTLTLAGDHISEADPTLAAQLTIATDPLLPLATAIPLSFTNTGTADALLDATGLAALSIPAGQSSTTAQITAVRDALLEGEETLILSLPGAGTAAEVTVFDSAYATWALAQLGNGGDILPGQDFDQDQASNLEEFAWGTDGADPSSRPVVPSSKSASHFKIISPPGPLPNELSVSAETSTDLLLWSPGGITDTGDGFEVPLGEDRRFLRLLYSLDP